MQPSIKKNTKALLYIQSLGIYSVQCKDILTSLFSKSEVTFVTPTKCLYLREVWFQEEILLSIEHKMLFNTEEKGTDFLRNVGKYLKCRQGVTFQKRTMKKISHSLYLATSRPTISMSENHRADVWVCQDSYRRNSHATILEFLKTLNIMAIAVLDVWVWQCGSYKPTFRETRCLLLQGGRLLLLHWISKQQDLLTS
jgi:hypothetical protein